MFDHIDLDQAELRRAGESKQIVLVLSDSQLETGAWFTSARWGTTVEK
jgi:hypothetical protein